MKTKALTAAQIDTLAQRLSETPIESTTSAKKAGDNFARLLAARIGGSLAHRACPYAGPVDLPAQIRLALGFGDQGGKPSG
jgi:hypothetical protein